MTSAKKTLVLYLASVLGSVVMIVSAYTSMASAQRAAQVAASDVIVCERLAANIESLKRRPELAGAQQLRLADLARLIETAAGEVGLPRGAVVRIVPEAGRRIGDGESPYVEHPTSIQLADVSMAQLVETLHRLVSTTPALGVRSIRVTAPRSGSREFTHDSSVWNAEVTVSYLVYTPRKETGR